MKRMLLSTKVALVLAGVAAFYSEQIKDNFINSKRPAVTKLTGLSQRGGGTGFYVKAPSGKIYTLTNGHVCSLGKDTGMLLSDDGSSIEAIKIVAVYEDNDLCLLEAPSYITSGLKVASSVDENENIYVLGHPLLEPKTLTKGQMSGRFTINVFQGYDVPCEGKTFKKIPVEQEDFIGFILGAEYACIRSTLADVVTANILPGNSGSPVLNAYGNVVGVAFAGAAGTGRGFIVPLEHVKNFLQGY